VLAYCQQNSSFHKRFVVRKKLKASPEIDKSDLQILNILQEDCRLSFRKIASQMGVSACMVASRIKKLEAEEIIRGYHVSLDDVKLGFDLTSVIFIQTEGGHLEDLENKLSQMANVIALYEITGDFDVVAVVKLKDRDSLNSLLKSLLLVPHIKKTMTDIAFNVVKEDCKIEL
jgi:Lrp/AsnC family transcriptional regulator, regulator for asnA, asnC and gidA